MATIFYQGVHPCLEIVTDRKLASRQIMMGQRQWRRLKYCPETYVPAQLRTPATISFKSCFVNGKTTLLELKTNTKVGVL